MSWYRLTVYSVTAAAIVCSALMGAGDSKAAKKRYKEIDVKNGGTITGKVVFNGQVPTVNIVIPEKDRAVCGDNRTEPLFNVNGDGGVGGVIVYLRKITKGKKWPKPAKPLVLKNIRCRFVPHSMVVRRGKLDIVNDDPVLHNIHGFYGQRTAFNLALPHQGQVIQAPIRRGGMISIGCDAHAWMHAHIYVARNPYYMITGADGTFSITDIPPGKYTLFASQGIINTVDIPVEVTKDGKLELTVELKI